jgi:hypothetical protein
MTQTRLQSLVESVINVGLGFIVSLIVQLITFPMFGIHLSIGGNLAVISIFTATSVIRSYVVRRYFNARLHHLAQRITGESSG